jgi:hypothetical protein
VILYISIPLRAFRAQKMVLAEIVTSLKICGKIVIDLSRSPVRKIFLQCVNFHRKCKRGMTFTDTNRLGYK